jgi:hypothetical protein
MEAILILVLVSVIVAGLGYGFHKRVEYIDFLDKTTYKTKTGRRLKVINGGANAREKL